MVDLYIKKFPILHNGVRYEPDTIMKDVDEATAAYLTTEADNCKVIETNPPQGKNSGTAAKGEDNEDVPEGLGAIDPKATLGKGNK